MQISGKGLLGEWALLMVVIDRLTAVPVPFHVRSNHVITYLSEDRHDMSELKGCFGKAMDEEDGAFPFFWLTGGCFDIEESD